MEPRASTALTAVGLAALRRAAVMAHTVGTITLRLSANDDHIVDVRPNAGAGTHNGLRVVDPCGFRMAVARAWSDHVMGREIGLIGLGPSDELRLDWSVAAPGQELGLGAVRAACAGRVVWAFASVLEPGELSAVMADMSAELEGVSDPLSGGAVDGISARLVHDELLDATVVHVEADPPAPTRVLDEVLRRMVAAAGASELTRDLASTSSSGD